MKFTNILTQIKQRGQKLEGKKRKIAKHIIDNYRDIAFSTLSELAAETDTSKATVLRVAQDLGFKGYQEMQESIQNVLKKELTTIDLYESYNQHEKKDKNIPARVLINDLEVIQHTLEQISVQKFDEITTRIVEADQVITMAIGKVSCLAKLLTSMLQPMLDDVRTITSASYLSYRGLATLSPNSLLITLGVSRYPSEVVSLVETANELNIDIVVITDSELSPLSEYADHLLITTVKRITWIDCYSGLLSLVQAIATDISIKTKQETLEKLERVEQVWEENNVFF